MKLIERDLYTSSFITNIFFSQIIPYNDTNFDKFFMAYL